MVSLLKGGAYLLGGTEIIPDSGEAAAQIKAKTGKEISKEQAKKETIAYGILENHNTSGNMDKLKIKFDKLTSHDITFVGKMHTRKLYRNLSKLPFLFFILTKGYIASFIRIKNKDTSFQSTPHDITIKKEESHD